MAARKKNRKTTTDFAGYVAGFPPAVRAILRRCRATIRRAAPAAVETISYNIPAFRLDGRIIVYFAGFKQHMGLYPPVRGDASLERAAAPYAGPKGNLQFPYDEPIPYGLIARIVRARAASRPGKSRK